jgi:putative N-acetylmannosamine-6-phosphate epimerase
VGATEGSGLPSWGATKVRRQLSTSCRAAAARCAEVGEVCDLGVDLLAVLGGERHRPEELAVRLAKLASQLVGRLFALVLDDF